MEETPRVKWVVTALVGSLVVILGRSAQAAPPETARDPGRETIVSLLWNRSPAATSCLGGAALERAVEQKVGRSVFAPVEGASLAIEGLAERDQAHGVWRATLALSSPGGTSLGRRELSSAAPGCGPLGEMVVLAIALMIRDRETLSASLQRAPPPPPALAPPSSLISSGPGSEAAGRTWEATSEASATLSAGLFPNPATGIRLRGVVRPARRLAFEVEGAVGLPSEARFGQQAGGRFFGAWLGGAVCPIEWSTRPWRVRLCAGGSIGVLFFRPFRTDTTGQQRQPLLIARVGGGFERAIGQSWFAAMSAELLYPAVRERFEIHDESGPHTLFQMTRVGVIGGFGVGRRF